MSVAIVLVCELLQKFVIKKNLTVLLLLMGLYNWKKAATSGSVLLKYSKEIK